MKAFETLDISGDAGIRAFGLDMKELFVNAACGMYGLITDPGSVSERKTLHVQAAGSSPESLLVSWLNELIFRFDAYGFIAAKITATDLSGRPEEAPVSWSISASLSGEDFDPSRHRRGLLIKAATYHDLIIRRREGLWETTVIFDI